MRLPYRNKKTTLWVLFGIIVVTMFLFKFTELRPTCLFRDGSVMLREEKYYMDANQKVYSYGRDMPIIFIGGVPRSGTTLMRAMLDAHPEVRCGQETRVIPRILQLRSHWLKSEKESLRLKEAGITKEVMNSAIAQFCLEIIAKHGDPAPRLCNKDPLTLKMGTYVIELFPNAKFLFMVRDGRATVHSIISRKVTITGFDLSSYRQCMQKWNQAIEVMHDQCKEIGKDGCMMVYYEQLVLHPEEWMRKILKFLDVPWNDAVLHHEEFINKPNGVPLSKVERSSDQVIKPVNLEALSKWVGNIPDDVVRDMADLAPMLSILGYDPYANPPDYGKPDAWVQDNTYKLKINRDIWENKAKEVLRFHSNDEDEVIDNHLDGIADHNAMGKHSNENNIIETIGNIAEKNNNDNKLNYENINNSKKQQQQHKNDLNKNNSNNNNNNNNNNHNKASNDMDYDDDGYNNKNDNNNSNNNNHDNHINDNDNNNQQAMPKEIITIKQLNEHQPFTRNNKDNTIDSLLNNKNKKNMSERT